ncbi:hypothetical protein ACJJTC_013356 [Scirpophaga incertulas]
MFAMVWWRGGLLENDVCQYSEGMCEVGGRDIKKTIAALVAAKMCNKRGVTNLDTPRCAVCGKLEDTSGVDNSETLARDRFRVLWQKRLPTRYVLDNFYFSSRNYLLEGN